MSLRQVFCYHATALLMAGAFLIPAVAHSQIATGAATQYFVEVQQVEKCSSSACTSPFVLGSTTQSFDIASASVGAQIGSYASTDGMPVGRTFTHIRLTMSRTIRVVGSATGGALAGITASTCTTDTSNDSGVAGAATAAADGIEGAGTATLQDLFVPTPGSFSGLPTSSSYTAQGIELPMTATTFRVTLALTSPHVVSEQPPLINVSFNTQTALGAFNGGSNNCKMIPQPPSVSISIQ